jgi:D-sedoheptulose 7-phosphate isomerase
MDLKTIALTGEGGGSIAAVSDHLFAVPSRWTALIQQAHICLDHYFCQAIERELAGRNLAEPVRATGH